MIPRTLRSMVVLALLGWPWAVADAADQPVPRKGQILDVSRDPVLAGLGVTRLTVDLDKQPAQEAARALSAEGVSMLLKAGPYRELDQQVVTLHLQEAPYMEGLMEMRQQLRARVSDVTGLVVTLTYAPKEEVPMWCVAGPFAVEYVGMSSEVVVPFDVRTMKSGEPARRAFLRLDLLAEPGINVMQALQDVQCPGLVDDKQQPIRVGPPKQTGILSLHPIELTLTLPESPGRRIPVLKGTVDAKIGRTVAVELASVLDKQTPPPVEGMTIEVSPLTPRNGSKLFFTMQVQYSRGTMAEKRWAELMPLLASAKLRISGSGKGGTISAHAPPLRRGGAAPVGDVLTVSYGVTVAQGAGEPGKATLEVPVGVTDVRVPFEFKDVVIP